MKSIKKAKKTLVLNKKTIAALNSVHMQNAFAGLANTDAPTCEGNSCKETQCVGCDKTEYGPGCVNIPGIGQQDGDGHQDC